MNWVALNNWFILWFRVLQELWKLEPYPWYTIIPRYHRYHRHNTGLNCSQTGRNGPGGLLPVWPFGVIALFTLRDHAVARAQGEYLSLLFPPFCSSHFFPPTTPCCPSVALLLCTIPLQPSLPFHDLPLVCMITLGFYELMSSSLLLPTHLCLCTAFTSPSRRYRPCHMPMTASTTYCTCTHTPAL